MRSLFVILAGALVTAILTFLAGFATYRRSTLSLPTPLFAHILAIANPSVTGLVAYKPTGGTSASLPFNLPSPLVLLSILDAVVLALAASDLRPQSLSCFLSSTWRAFFQAKNQRAIRHIQDTLDCCGFRSVVDEAWPFPDKEHGANACMLAFKRTRSCEGLLVREEKIVLGLLVAIAACGLLGKALLWVLIQRRPAWFHQQRARNEHTFQGRIAQGSQRIEAIDGRRYLDEPGDDAVVPSEANGNHISDNPFREG